MIILSNIFKKASDFAIIGVVACMLLLTPGEVNAETKPIPGACQGVSKECCTEEGYVPGDIQQSTNKYKARDSQSCLSSLPVGSSPVTYVSSLPGERSCKNCSDEHKGMDIAAVAGTAVYAAADGTIDHVDPGCYGDTGAGIYVQIKHELDPNSIYATETKSCGCYYTKYMHLSKIADGVKVGKKYKKGTEIGKVGGSSCEGGILKLNKYGNHLHYEIRVGAVKGTVINPLCPDNQNLCDGSPKIETFSDKLEEATYNDSAEPLEDCSKYATPTKDYVECMDRNKTKEQTRNGGRTTSSWATGNVWSGENLYTSTSGTLEQAQSDYSCSLLENFSSIDGCLFCKLFEVIFNTASSVARFSHTTFADSMIPLLAVGLAIWIAVLVLKYVSDMTVKDPLLLLNDILKKVFVVIFIIVLLKLDVTEFFNMFITPVFDTGFKLAQLVMGKVTCDTWPGIDGSGLPSNMGNSMLCAIDAIQNRLERLIALGSNAICIAFHVKSFKFIIIFPHFGYLITGLFLWLIAIVFMLAYPFLLIDSVLQFAIATSLFPVALAGTAFKITSKYLNIWKVVNIFMNAMFTFIFLTLVLFILLSGIDSSVMKSINHAFEASSGGDYFSLEALGWHTKTFMELVFFLFLGKAVLNDIPNFAGGFAKAISLGASGGKPDMGIGRKVGGMAVGAATNVGKEAVSITGGALKTGGAIAGQFVSTAAKSARYEYLMRNTQRRLEEQRMRGDTSGVVTGRDWLGRRVTRRIVTNPDGTTSLQSTRRGMFNKNNNITTHQNKLMSIQTKTFKDGSKQEKFAIKSAYAKSLINSDGTRNDVAVNALLQSSGLTREEANKVILNQMLKQRMPNAKGANLEGKYKAETVNSYINDKGQEVFEVRRTMEDGSVKVFRMTKGATRDMIEFEQITKTGKATKLASDGVIQMHDEYEYDTNNDGTFKVENKVNINGAEVENAKVGADGVARDKDGNAIGTVLANGNVTDNQGNVIGTAYAPDLIFDSNGDVLGKLNDKGRIVDANGKVKGVVDSDGNIMSIDSNNLNSLLGSRIRGQTIIGNSNIARKAYGKVFGDKVGELAPENRGDIFSFAKIKEGSRQVKFSNAKSFKGAKLYDIDGNIENSFVDTEIMFGEDDLTLYKHQMKKYGDVLQQYRFGR